MRFPFVNRISSLCPEGPFAEGGLRLLDSNGISRGGVTSCWCGPAADQVTMNGRDCSLTRPMGRGRSFQSKIRHREETVGLCSRPRQNGALLMLCLLVMVAWSVTFGGQVGGSPAPPSRPSGMANLALGFGYEDGCGVTAPSAFSTEISAVYSAAGLNGSSGSALPSTSQLDSEVMKSWAILCVSPGFSAAALRGGLSNFSFGLEVNPAARTGNATFSESWASNLTLVEDSWMMNIIGGNLSGPYQTTHPLTSVGGTNATPEGSPPNPPSKVSLNGVQILALASGSAIAGAAGGMATSQRRRRSRGDR
jgi:hypothetical protein